MLKNIVLSLLALIAFFILFVDINGLFPERLTVALWPLGHLGIFALWSALLLHFHPTLKSASLTKQLMILTVLCFSFGLFIELVQPYFSRTMEVSDLFLNYLGVLISFVLFHRRTLHWLLLMACFALVSVSISSSALMVYDEIKAQVDFPVLASFQQEIELTRWKADQPLSIGTPEGLIASTSMMKITFVPRSYSGVALRYFPKQWQDYQQLIVRFYNPNSDVMPVTLIITDQHYNKANPNYKDRYEQHLRITPGFSEQQIPLSTIRDQVILRKMDLRQMAGVDFYMYKLDQPIHLYLDSIYLK